MERKKTPIVRDLKLGTRITFNILSKTFEPVAEIAKKEAMIKLNEILHRGGRS